jgi:hypothetical protein
MFLPELDAIFRGANVRHARQILNAQPRAGLLKISISANGAMLAARPKKRAVPPPFLAFFVRINTA